MTLQIQEPWQRAAAMLPKPERAQLAEKNGFRFSAARFKSQMGWILCWELCERHWIGTGKTFGEWDDPDAALLSQRAKEGQT